MAAALARRLLGTSCQVDSAGTVVSPFTMSANEEAILTMRKLYFLDISAHHPRQIGRADLVGADLVIAMDSSIEDEIHRLHGYAARCLRNWNLSDPYLRGSAAYEACARELEDKVMELSHELAAWHT
jgi:protein-tyrosine-phosphatase